MKKKGEINYNGKQHWTVYVAESRLDPRKAEMFIDADVFTVRCFRGMCFTQTEFDTIEEAEQSMIDFCSGK